MKKILILFLFSSFLLSCATMQTDPAKPNICTTRPPGTQSWLCEAATKANITLESIDGMLLDASAATVIVAKVEREKVQKFLYKINGMLDKASIDKLTYTLLINTVIKDIQDAQLLSSIVNRRITSFYSTEVILPYDIYLLKEHIKHQCEMFGFPPPLKL